MSKLKSLDLDKNTIVVFTSEHGRMMGKFGIAPKRFMYDASARIPLIIKAPGYKAKKVSYPVSQIDIVPTLLELFGKKVPTSLPGKNLFDFESNDVFIEWNTDFTSDEKPTNGKKYTECPTTEKDCSKAMLQNIRTVVTNSGLKLSISAQDFDLSELYDLKNDPKEKNNLFYQYKYRDTITVLKQRILEWQKRVNDSISL
jgi:arylsulfatase A-like enzyme